MPSLVDQQGAARRAGVSSSAVGRAARSASDARPSRPRDVPTRRTPRAHGVSTTLEPSALAAQPTVTTPLVEQQGAPATRARRDRARTAPAVRPGVTGFRHARAFGPPCSTNGDHSVGRAARSASDARPSRPREVPTRRTPWTHRVSTRSSLRPSLLNQRRGPSLVEQQGAPATRARRDPVRIRADLIYVRRWKVTWLSPPTSTSYSGSWIRRWWNGHSSRPRARSVWP